MKLRSLSVGRRRQKPISRASRLERLKIQARRRRKLPLRTFLNSFQVKRMLSVEPWDPAYSAVCHIRGLMEELRQTNGRVRRTAIHPPMIERLHRWRDVQESEAHCHAHGHDWQPETRATPGLERPVWWCPHCRFVHVGEKPGLYAWLSPRLPLCVLEGETSLAKRLGVPQTEVRDD